MRPFLAHPFDDDKLKEECGIYGVIGLADAANFVALGLHALQHRGQEAGGIVSYDPQEGFNNARRFGYVRDNFTKPDVMATLPGSLAIGHVRYSTAGTKGQTAIRDVQPFFGEFAIGGCAIAHNGNLTNATALRRQLIERGAIFQSSSDSECIIHLMARSMRAAGGRAGDMVHVAYGYGMFTGGLGAHYGVERLGCCAVPMSGGQTEKQVQQIMDFKPEIIMVTPSYSLVIAEEFERLGIGPGEISLTVGLFGAEPWGEGMRGEIERKLGIDAIDIYGLTEVIGPGVASECIETKDGPVIWEDHFYPEIIDPESGAVLPDGEVGELVFTSLTKEAFPVIRYRTRDLTRLLPPTARAFRRIGKITGRTDDMMICLLYTSDAADE